jgi:GTP pyrophosphokinase
MSAPAIAIYTGAPGGVSQLPSEPPSTASTSGSKPGGLSMLFSSSSSLSPPTISHHVVDDLSRSDDLGCSSYSFTSSFSNHSSFSKSREHHSPVSVFQSPASTSRSPPVFWAPQSSHHSRGRSYNNSFVRHALGSCLDYVPPLSPSYQEEGMSGELGLEFDMGSTEIGADYEPYAKEMLLGAQSRHKIFHEELVIKAFSEAEKAHRCQVLFSIFRHFIWIGNKHQKMTY